MNGKRPGGWVALAWRYYNDPKFDGLSAAAVVLWINGLCYAAEQETDGIVPRSKVLTIAHRDTKRPLNVARSLVRAGLWIETADGFRVPFEKWDRWQDTADQRSTARAKTAERTRRWRARDGVSDATRDATAGAGAGAGAVRSTSTPAPRSPSGLEIDHQFAEGQEPAVVIDDHGRWFVVPPSPNGDAS